MVEDKLLLYLLAGLIPFILILLIATFFGIKDIIKSRRDGNCVEDVA